jgi:GTP-binding protein EngB required for normal cell division
MASTGHDQQRAGDSVEEARDGHAGCGTVVTWGSDPLRSLLRELSAVVPAADAPVVEELRRRVARRVLRVLVVGEAKRGKSTLINALVGWEALPTGVAPVTAVPTTVVHGAAERLQVRFADGSAQQFAVGQLAAFVTEAGNPANTRGVTDVVVTVPLPFLADGIELVDTPGVGSVHEHNTGEAMLALQRMDAAILVLTADPPISASERTFLRHVRQHAVMVFCVLNKVDRLSAGELAEARVFTERVLAEELGADVPAWPISARSALSARGGAVRDDTSGDTGFDAFAGAFAEYLGTSQARDLTRSVATRAERLARGVAETAAATLAALAISEDSLAEKVEMFSQQLAAVTRDRAESQAVAAGECQRLLTETNQQATALYTEAAGPLLTKVSQHLTELSGPMRTIEADALAYAADEIRVIVEAWRSRRATELDAAVADLDQRLTSRLLSHIAAVRDSAAALFAMDLPAPASPTGLAGTTRFAYRFHTEPGQLDLLAAAMRHRLPAAAARQRATRYAMAHTGTLLDKHIGRARSDFQDQLAETRRLLLAELDRRFDQAAGRIADAVTTTARIRREQGTQVETVRRDAQNRQTQASTLATAFAAFGTDARAATGG